MAEDEYPGTVARVLLVAVTASFFPFAMTTHLVKEALQVFFIHPPCPANLTDANSSCCHSCLGLSEFEFGYTSGIASCLSFPVVFLSGTIVDFFGLPTAMALISLATMAGAAARVLEAMFTGYHVLVLCVEVLSRALTLSVYFTLPAIKQYVSARFFPPKQQPLVIGILFAVSAVSSLSAVVSLPRLALSYGFRLTLFFVVFASFVMFLSTALLWLIFRLRDDVVAAQEELDSRLLLPSNVFSRVRSAPLEFWLVAVALANHNAVYWALVGNLQLLQMRLLHLHLTTVADYLSLSWLLQACGSPVIGLLIKWLPHRTLVGLFACAMQVIAFSILFVPHTALSSDALAAMSFPISMMALTSILRDYVEVEDLGLATTTTFAVSLPLTGVWVTVVGRLLQLRPLALSAKASVCLLIGAMIFSVIPIVILLRRRRSKGAEELNEEDRLIKDDKSN